MADTQQLPQNNPEEPGVRTTSPSETEPSTQDYRRFVWQGKIGPAFWTVTRIFSLLLNAILVAVIILLGREIFTIKSLVGDQLVSGLAENFALMDQAVIRSTVVVNDQIPVQFTLPVSKKTTVVLTEDTLLSGARVNLATGGYPLSTRLLKPSFQKAHS